MELLIVAEKASSQISRQHLIKILNYVNAFADCFSTIHLLSAFDRTQLATMTVPSQIIIHDLGSWQDVRGFTRLVRHLVYFWRLFRTGRKLLQDRPEIQIVTHPFGHTLTGLVVITLARFCRRKSLIRVAGDLQTTLLTLRFRYGRVVATFLGGLLSIIECFVLWQADRIIAISPVFLTHRPQYANKTAIVPNLFPVVDRHCTQVQAVQPKTVLLNGTLKILSVGRLAPEKGLSILLKALAGLPAICCQIVGGGELRQQLEQLAQELGLATRVTFCGPLPQDRVFELMAEADVLVLPSLTEYTPNVLIEAGALGLPAIATDVGGVRYIIQDGQNGLLCKAGDAESLRDRLLYFSRHPDLWPQWSENARRWTCNTYATPVIRQQAETFLRRWLPDMA